MILCMKEKNRCYKSASFHRFSFCGRVQLLFFFVVLMSFGNITANKTSNKESFKVPKLTNKSLGHAIDVIEQNSSYVFVYNNADVDLKRKVSLKENLGIEATLNELFKDTGNSYRISGNQIYITKEVKMNNPQQNSYNLKGKVVDKNGEPLYGTAIVIKGTTVGTTADIDGNFSLNVVVGQTLEISSLGFVKQEILISNQKRLDIKMEEDATMLEDMVVVGYGKQKKASVVGSVQSISPSDLKVPSTQLSTSFAGRVAGVIAVQRSGQPGADGANFWIRGISTIGGITSPLIILDGVQVSASDLNNLDPEVIESFSVLKDATATALYGTLGANGVMIVTTKSGKNMDKPRINVRVEGSVSAPTYDVNLVDGVKYMQMYNEGAKNESSSSFIPYSKEKIQGTIAGNDPLMYPNVNWYNELFKDSQYTQKGIVNIMGGSSKVDYFSSLSASHESGMLRSRSKEFASYNNNISIWRYNFQNNINIYPTSTTKIAVRLNVQLKDENAPVKEPASLFSDIIYSNPVDFPILYPGSDSRNNSQNPDHTMWGGKIGTSNRLINPLAEMVRGYRDFFESTVIASIDFEQKLDFITEGLAFKGQYSFKNWAQTSTTRSANYNQFYVDEYYYDGAGNVINYDLTNANGADVSTVLGYGSGAAGDRSMYIQAMLDYNRTFNKVHHLGAMALYNQREFNNNFHDSFLASLPERKQGIAGRLTYSYDYRYAAEFNFGYNGSEGFAEGHRFGFFPSFALGYTISEESFWQPLKKYVSSLKLRGSWGQVGNDRTGSERFIYMADINLYGTGYTTGVNQNYSQSGPVYNRYQNNNITWEVGTKTNAGIDVQLFNNFSIVFDVFKEDRKNIFLTRQSIPRFFGTANTAIYGNLARVENKGFDGSIDYNKQINKDLFISLKGTFSFAKNKVLEYDEPAFKMYPGNSRVGHSVNQQLLYIADRLFIDGYEVASSPTQLIGGFVNGGDIKYVDQLNVNGETDGKIDANDRVYSGYPTVPEIVYGFGPSLQWKKWDFSLFFQGAAHTSLVMSNFHPFGTNWTRNVLQFIADDYWSESNQDINAGYPRLSIADNANNTAASTYWLRDASFLKLKNIELGYSFKFMRFYLSGANILTFSPFKHWDPEMGGGSGLQYPTMRTFNLGIQMTL